MVFGAIPLSISVCVNMYRACVDNRGWIFYEIRYSGTTKSTKARGTS